MEMKAKIRMGVLAITGQEMGEDLVARVEYVKAALDSLAVWGLTDAEKTAVCVALHSEMAEKMGKTSVVVQATAFVPGAPSAHSELVIQETTAPGLVAETVAQLVQFASPALWSGIRASLEEELLEKAVGPAQE